jgi:selenocysteine-specific elongation factor
LSTITSTACFDKNPQSQQRGITLDLGFSSFSIDSNDLLKSDGYQSVQYTLVDCPGHASLIKTIIGGAQIIDMMILVIDIVKGFQTQTAECLIIGEICCDKMLIVLNKLDLIEMSKRIVTIDKMTKRVKKTLEKTKFANAPVVAVAANVNSGDVESGSSTNDSNLNIQSLIDQIKQMTFVPDRRKSIGSPFLFAVDHCFPFKGQGTIMTGTILSGQVKVNDTIEIPIVKEQKKIKSLQVFRKSVEKALVGDRCGLCLANFDSKQLERGIACTPGYARYTYGLIINFNKIKYFKMPIQSGALYHMTLGHETVIGKVELFYCKKKTTESGPINDNSFDFSQEYLHLDEYKEEEDGGDGEGSGNNYYAFIDLTFESADSVLLCTPQTFVIGSKLDIDIHLNQCRIAFYGFVCHAFFNNDYKDQKITPPTTSHYLSQLNIYKNKKKEGIVERQHDEYTIICKQMFKKETNIDLFVGMKVELSTGEQGSIEAGFGQSGKFKVRLTGISIYHLFIRLV